MKAISALGKYLDQPILVSKFQKAVPAVLAAGVGVYTLYDVSRQDKEKKKETAIKTGITLGVTALSALAAPYIASKISGRPLPSSLDTIKKNNKTLIDNFLAENQLNDEIKTTLNKAKEHILGLKEVKNLYEKVGNVETGKFFLEKLIPSPQNISAKDIFSEIGYLSIYGAVPVIGGITGGIAADKITDKENWKEKIPNKIKEGSYQYLANIFMCNVGAGIALGILEKMKITSKGARAAGMIAGIIATGIIGGSKIANFIGDKLIDPLFQKSQKKRTKEFSDILDINFIGKDYSDSIECSLDNMIAKNKERTPELLDVGLHTDDIATVSLLSGLKWIEPALPLMYTLSGYRAGIGYRN